MQSFVSRLRAALDDMPPMERQLGELALNFPGDLASYTASELGALAGVSNSTVSRFIHRLGYENYEAARRQVRAEKSEGSPLFLAVSNDKPGSIAAHVAQAQDNLNATFVDLDDTTFDVMARSLLRARKVWIVGFRSSHSFATYLRWQILQVFESVEVIPGPGETFGEYAAGMSKSDCLVVFALRRRVPQVRVIVDHALSAGASVLYVTDALAGRLKMAPTWTVRCQTRAAGPLDNHVAVTAFCHLLATKVIEAAGSAGRRRLTAVELAHERLAEL